MIPYVEIIDKTTLKVTALVEPQECWFELSYFDVGECELYCVALSTNLANLLKGNYLKIPNKPYIWVITSLTYTYVEGVPMIDAKGYEAKWLLNKRVIRAPIELPNQVALAVEQLVYNNLGAGAAAVRQIAGFNVYTSGIKTTNSYVEETTLYNLDAATVNLSTLNQKPKTTSIKDTTVVFGAATQAPRGNLLEFVNNILKTYNLGSIVTYENEQLVYKVIQGQDLSASVRFSQSLDNLIESNYYTDDSKIGTNALVVSTVDDVDYWQVYDEGATGVDRAEILINSNISTEYTPQGATDPVKLDLTNPTDLALYYSWLQQEGRTGLAEYIENNEVSSTLDLVNSNYEFSNDYFIGDIVGVIDEYFNYNASARIIKFTFKQDSGGYGEEADYQ